MLVVTHDLPFAAELCERAVMLSGGRIVADGRCADDPAPTSELLAAHDLELPVRSAGGSCSGLICTFRHMADVAMPRLSDSMEEGTILKWLKSDGDEVSRGDEIVEIETDKANMTYEADQDGALTIVAQEGDTLAVGETIARIGEGGESNGAAPAEREAEEGGGDERRRGRDGHRDRRGAAAGAARRSRRARSPPSRNRPGAATAASRRRRSRAGWRASSASSCPASHGTGPGGRIVKADVEAAVEGRRRAAAEAPGRGSPPQPAEPEREEAEGRRRPSSPATRRPARARPRRRTSRACSRRSRAAWPSRRRRRRSSSSTSTSTWRRPSTSASGSRPPRTRASPCRRSTTSSSRRSALALLDFPRANGAYRDGKFELYSRVNVGVAVAGQDALVVPTVFDADRKSLGQISRETRALAERVRAGAITPPELSVGHVHRLQPRHVRHPELRRRDQPAAGGDPGRRRDGADAGRARRRGRRPQHHAADAGVRPPDPLRRRRRRVPGSHPRAAREPAPAGALGTAARPRSARA